MKNIITVRAIGRERTEEEKHRRHIYGDKDAKFSSRQMKIAGDISGTVTTLATKDNLVAEFYEEESDKCKDYGNAREKPY